MKHINLYQSAFHPPRTVVPARQILTGGAVFLCGLLALYAWDAWRLTQLKREVGQLTARATTLEAQVNSGQATQLADPHVLAEAERMETRLHNLQRAQDALNSGALGSETGYSGHFRALSRARVAGAWLTRVEIDERGQAMNLHGRALTGEDSARLIAGLRREPLFVGLSFATLAVAPPKIEAPSGAARGETRGAADDTPPRFLEFILNARVPETAETRPAPVAGGQPAGTTLPELLAGQAAAQAENAP